MASLVSGFEYDIFISYRQKDNKHDGWVTEFADNLKGELESTFKEEISVYFDINPHDGLLETHDVGESLKEKLKCLVFIPIISRTYCDPKSFAWEHEFKAFVEQASQDQFGLKVKLPNGNVANRVLPIRIYDLDNADIKLCETVLGGVLRGIEFIYKETGVNRPLTTKDNEEKNLNHTNYRNQINKVGNAIKEIIQGLTSEPARKGEDKVQPNESFKEAREDDRKIDLKKSAKSGRRKLISAITISAFLVIAAILGYPKIFKRDTLEKLQSSGKTISVAVMPFQNLTGDTAWNIWQKGIQNELIMSLTNSEELAVRQTESVNTLIQSRNLPDMASLTPSIAGSISKKLRADVFINGNINKAGSRVHLNVQLTASKTGEVFKAFQIEGSSAEENIFRLTDSLSLIVRNFLLISILKKEESPTFRYWASSASNPEAYHYFILGQDAFCKFDWLTAIKLFTQSITIDSNYYWAIIRLSSALWNYGSYDEAKKWCLKVYEKRDEMPVSQKIYTNWVYSLNFETPFEEINYLDQLKKIDNQWPGTYYNLGMAYNNIHQYDKAIPEFKKALEIYHNWDVKPMWSANYLWLGWAYQQTGKIKLAMKLSKKAARDFPDDISVMSWLAILELMNGDTFAAEKHTEKFLAMQDWFPHTEVYNMYLRAYIYNEAGILDKAEEYFRKSLAVQPEKYFVMYELAKMLIDKDRNVNEGLELIDKMLKLVPDSYELLAYKGWGLYNQGKYKAALDLLEKSWDSKPVYNHDIYLHLQAAKKAVAGQKNN